MAHINPALPNDGDSGWGDTLNGVFGTVIAQVNTHDDQIATLSTSGGTGSSSSPAVFAPEDYGAAGDGSTDDTTSVQATINAAATYLSNNPNHSAVVAIGGTYLLSATLNMTSRVAFAGVSPEGCGFTTTGVSFSGTSVLNIAPSSAASVALDSFSIVDSSTTRSLIKLTNTIRASVTNLSLSGGQDQIQIVNCTDLNVSGNVLRNGVNAFAFRTTNSPHVRFQNNRVRDVTYVYFLESSGIVTSLAYSGDEIINGGSGANVTNNYSWLAATQVNTPKSGTTFHSGTSANSAVVFLEPNSGAKTHVRRGQFALEFLNNTFTTVIASLDNGGELVLNDALKMNSSTVPTAASSEAGSVRYHAGATGVADTLQACLKNSSNSYSWVNIGGVSGSLNNYTATSDPTVSSDSSAGYSVGSMWVNTSTATAYEALSVSVGAAVWRRLTADVQVYTGGGSATWTKPAWATTVQVALISGGGGGGAGRRGASGTASSGGAGGGGGGFASVTLSAAACGATESIQIGTGGPGAPAQTTDSTNGVSGTVGSSSYFGSKVRATGATAGAGGQSGTTSTGGSGGSGVSAGGSGGAGTSGAVGSGGSNGSGGAAGGGGGGGITSAPAFSAGGTGGTSVPLNSSTASGGATDGASGAAGASAAANSPTAGAGGAGGASSITGAGGAGGAGGTYGAGGGGGGASLNGAASGAGGAGASGIVVVISQ